MSTITIYCDGSCEPVNPNGHATWAWVAYGPNGRKLNEDSGYLGHGPGMTNNRAEYAALIAALHYTTLRCDLLVDRELSVQIHMDSQLVVNHVNGY